MSFIFESSNGRICLITRGAKRSTDTQQYALNTSYVSSINNESLSISSGLLLTKGLLIFERVSKTEADNFKKFLASDLRFYSFTFSITPDSHTDLGNGKGSKIENVKYTGSPSTGSVITVNGTMSEKYTIQLPFEYNNSIGGFGEL